MPELSREQLYAEIWGEPMLSLAQKYGLSDVGLAKHCRAVDVPTPPRGYWAKKASGQAPRQLPLPPRGPGCSNYVRFGASAQYRWSVDLATELAERLPEEPMFSEPIEQVIVRIAQQVGRVPSRTFSTPHPLIAKLLEADDKLRQSLKSHPHAAYLPKPRFEGPVQRRRLKIANVLFNALAKAGSAPDLQNKETLTFSVRVGTVEVPFTLDTPPRKPVKGRAVEEESLTLRLEIGGRSESDVRKNAWMDDEQTQIEDHFTEVVVALITAGELGYRERAQSSYRWALKRRVELEALLEAQRLEAERKAQEAERKAQQKRREHLWAQARDWRLAEDIRGFVAAMKSRAASDNVFERWEAWALGEAASLDPTNQLTIIEPKAGSTV